MKTSAAFRYGLPALEALGRVAADPQGSDGGVEFDAQGSLLFMGGSEAGAPHGSAEAADFEAEPWGVRNRSTEWQNMDRFNMSYKNECFGGRNQRSKRSPFQL